MKNHEVEFRAFIDKRQKKQLMNLLEGSDPVEVYIKDAYYCLKSVKKFSEVEMDVIGSFSLRLREAKSFGKSKYTINVKVITSYGDHNAWDEHEIEVDSISEAQRIFVALQFKPFFNLEKTRQTFEHDGMSVNLEEIKGASTAVEVEIITSRADANKAKSKILDFLGSCSIDLDQIEKKSLTNTLMRKLSKF